MDMSDTIAAKSDQQNYDDYLAGTRTVTITAVNKGSAEQPVDVELLEYPGRPFKPNKTMRRVLVLAWGVDSKAYVGRQLKLFGNPGVIYGGKAVGGVEIEAMSHLEKPLTVALTATRGKRKSFTIKPLATVAPRDWFADLAAAGTDLAAIAALGNAAIAAHATQDVLEVIRARHGEIKAAGNE